MSRDLFSQFSHTVCREILFRPARKGVAAELTAHLEDAAEHLAGQGVPEEEARARAVAAMGDPVSLGKALHRQHWPILGWLSLLWPPVVLLLLILRTLVWPNLPDTLYLRMAGVDPRQVVFSAHQYEPDGQFGVYVTKEGYIYHFYRTAEHPVLSYLLTAKAAKVTCHVSYNTVTGKVTRYIETPGSCYTQYPDDLDARYVFLRYSWTTVSFGTPHHGVYYLGLMPEEEVDPAWTGELYQTVENNLVLFAGYEEGVSVSWSYSLEDPLYDLRMVE